MRFLFVDEDELLLAEGEFRPSAASRHYLEDVLRIGEGCCFEIVTRGGAASYLVRVRSTGGARRGRRRYEIVEPLREREEEFGTSARNSFHLTLGIPPLKGDRWRYAVEKAVECGVDAFLPLKCAHGVRRLDEAGIVRRMIGMVESACQQCGRRGPPRVEKPRAIGEIDEEFVRAYDACFVGVPPGARDLGDALSSVLPQNFVPASCGPRRPEPSPDGACLLLVGPEGDFSASELEHLRGLGMAFVAVDGAVLRSETAAVVLSVLLRQALGGLSLRVYRSREKTTASA